MAKRIYYLLVILLLLLSTTIYAQKFSGNDFTTISSFVLDDSTVGLYDNFSGVRLTSNITDSVEVIIMARCTFETGFLKCASPGDGQKIFSITTNSYTPISMKFKNINGSTWTFQFMNDHPDRDIFIRYIEIKSIKIEIPNVYKDFIISWKANIEDDLMGYKVYYGRESKSYYNTFFIADTFYKVSLPCEIMFYFAVTALDTVNNESDFSDEVFGMCEIVEAIKDSIPPDKVLINPLIIE